MTELPNWLSSKRKERFDRTIHAQDRRKYGITITLKPIKDLESNQEDSEQVVTIEHDQAQIFNLFEELDNPLVEEHLLSTQPSERTVLEDIAESRADIGLLIIAPPNSTCSIDLTRTITSKHFSEYILLVAQQGATVTIIDKISSQPTTTLRTQVIEVIAEQGARVKYATLHADNKATNLVSTQRAKLASNAHIDWFNANLGANKARITTDCYLDGEQSTAKPYGVFLATNDEQFDIAATTFHKGNKSSSDMYTRGVLGGRAQAVFRGLLDIDSEAYDCDGYQTEETILISDHAIADAIPNLQIRNNQVKCSHGASIGRVDDEQLFYLTSRGINPEEATKMIVRGFFEPVTTKLKWPELFTYIETIVRERVA